MLYDEKRVLFAMLDDGKRIEYNKMDLYKTEDTLP